MPRTRDKSLIRAILSTDRNWSLYALGDLTPGFFERCEWFQSDGDTPGLLLLYRAYETPVLFGLGDVRPLLVEIANESSFYLQVRPDVPSLLEATYQIAEIKMMWRMILNPSRYQPHQDPEAVRIGPDNGEQVRELFADGDANGEAPDFYSADMLELGCFFGIRDQGSLIAAAGTHLVSQQEGIAAVGCVYTRRDRRGRGLAGRVTSAVIEHLLSQGICTIGLNVKQRNQSAMRIYERLGFEKYCEFCEGIAHCKPDNH